MARVFISSYFSSLDFSDWKHDFETDECYVQKFSRYDNIRVQVSIDSLSDITIRLNNLTTNVITPITLTPLGTKDGYDISFFQITDQEEGCYRIEVLNNFDEIISYSNYSILPRESLENTVRLRYTHRINEFDVYFYNEETQYSFDFRVEGGFLYGEMQFPISNNSFRNQRYENIQLSASPYEVHTLTIGTGSGVPVWAARKANLIFSLSDVAVNGVPYVRSESSEPEITELGSDYPLYVIKIALEPTEFYSYYNKEYPYTYFVLGTEDNNILGTEDLKALVVQNYQN